MSTVGPVGAFEVRLLYGKDEFMVFLHFKKDIKKLTLVSRNILPSLFFFVLNNFAN
jgi:hypothetical protein